MTQNNGKQTLRQWREARGWTQFELAVKSGVSLSSVVNIETSRQIPGLALARKLAQAVGAASVEDIAWPTPDQLKRRHPKRAA